MRFRKHIYLILSSLLVFMFAWPISADQGLLLSSRRRDSIPIGIIFPMNTAVIPSGVERFTSADGKVIIGAGSTYAVGATGGTATASISKVTSTDGAHNPTTDTFPAIQDTGGAPGGGSVVGSGVSAGGHAHTVSGTYTRAYQQLVLVRTIEALPQFPANAIVLSDQATTPVSGLSICYDDDVLLRSGATIASDAGTFSAMSVTTAGAHKHDNDGTEWTASGGGETGYLYDSAGGHNDHAITPGLEDEELKRIYMTAWTATDGFKNEAGVICMWESLTPPPGWELVSSVYDYFIKLGSDVVVGDTYDETNRISVSLAVGNSDNPHGHKLGGNTDTLAVTSYHTSVNNTHGHTIATSWISHTPAYYALAFIRKL